MESECEMWQDVSPTMMSDEEDVGDNTFPNPSSRVAFIRSDTFS